MYDIVVIGSGVSSLFFLHGLEIKNKKILVLEKGKELDKRKCPKVNNEKCRCKVCDRHYGLGGPLKHEGKFNYTNDFGGSLGVKIGNNLSLSYQKEVDDILMSYSKNNVELYSTYNKNINYKAKKVNLETLSTNVRHLGIENTYQVFSDLYFDLKDKIEFQFNVEDVKIAKKDGMFIIDNTVKAHNVVIATNKFNPNEICPSLEIKHGQFRIDIGLRIEMLKNKWDDLLSETFETKLKYKDSYTYCMNPNGKVVKKIQSGYEFADGQNYNESSSENINFTLFYPEYFATDFEANNYLKDLMNKIDNQIALQNIGKCNNINPTLDQNFSNVFENIPSKYVANLMEFLTNLELLLGQDLDDDILVYAFDYKHYAPIIETDINFQSSISGLYVIGDCSGVSASLSQAAASGIYLSRMFN